jgi:protein TonB
MHIAALLYITVTTGTRELRDEADVFKLVDVREYVPPPPPPSPPKPKPKEEVVETPPQETIAETVIETEKIVVETPAVEPPSPPPPVSRDPEYLPQHKISKPPGIPQDRIRANIVYPPLANRQRIEGVVYLELFIDREGVIRKIDVLRDPGYGLAEAAVAAFRGITCTPAEANGEPVAVRFRYPIRFQLR